MLPAGEWRRILAIHPTLNELIVALGTEFRIDRVVRLEVDTGLTHPIHQGEPREAWRAKATWSSSRSLLSWNGHLELRDAALNPISKMKWPGKFEPTWVHDLGRVIVAAGSRKIYALVQKGECLKVVGRGKMAGEGDMIVHAAKVYVTARFPNKTRWHELTNLNELAANALTP